MAKIEYPEACPLLTVHRDPWEDDFQCRRDLMKIYANPKNISLTESEKQALDSVSKKICQYCIQQKGIYR